ncbi:hypothetical protein [Neoactinobaculum massilliense]|uniref:hypothetical protein n=1 Tax=Neoactinobaculum massilliense TaxID=2364794 RepID=UPI000F526646|nr:hypothetical protein [Neoactinobaculum massilliense]
MRFAVLWMLVVLAIVVVAVWAVIDARRIDRLHVTILKSRQALEQALANRAQVAHEVGVSSILDMAGAVVLVDAADHAMSLSMVAPVDDALGAITDRRAPTVLDLPSPRLRREAESNLSRALRLTVDGIDRSDISPAAQHSLDRLSRARLDVRLTRSFHNSHVAQARQLRASLLPRLLHLAGTAPVPRTVDIDDE